MNLIGVIDASPPQDIADRLYVYHPCSDESSDHPKVARHGSAIAGAILNNAPEAHFAWIQVFGNSFVTTPQQIAEAIETLLQYPVAVINLSLGLHNNRAVLAQAVEKALEKGVTMIASSPARGKPVYPAAYPGVFAVCGDARCKPDEFSSLGAQGPASFGACTVSTQEPEIGGASIATAHFSGILAQALTDISDHHNLDAWLKEGANYLGRERVSVNTR